MYLFSRSGSIGTLIESRVSGTFSLLFASESQDVFVRQRDELRRPILKGLHCMDPSKDKKIERVLNGEDSVLFLGDDDPRNQPLGVMSGAFNPLHQGHLEMAQVGANKLGRKIVFELCLDNADKAALTLTETKSRIEQDFTGPIALTRAPTFLEKASIFPQAAFLVGVDTLYRIGLPRFYEDNVAMRDMAIEELAGFGCSFLVFGREIEGRFIGLRDLELPSSLKDICQDVAEADFRSEISSSKLRDRDA